MDTIKSSKLYIVIAIVLPLLLLASAFFFFYQQREKQEVISGIFTISGTIPSNTNITLLARDTSSNTPTLSTMPAKDLGTWQFTKAEKGKTYEIKAQIDIGGKTIESNSLTITSPAYNQVLRLSLPTNTATTVTPTKIPNRTITITPAPIIIPVTPTPSTLIPTPVLTPTASSSALASISGTLTFTGQPPVSSRVVIFERTTGTTNYQVAVDNFIPYASSVWMWNGTPNTSYDFIAILKQKQSNGTDVDLASSTSITATAPSTTANLSITYAATLSAPGPNISVTCNTLDGPSQTWNASVNFQTITGAASYWFQIGTTDGGIDLVNSTMNAQSGNNQVLSEPLKNGTTYYAKYAYAGIPNISANASQFSPLSNTAQFKCQ